MWKKPWLRYPMLLLFSAPRGQSADMPKGRYSGDVVCPYYKRDDAYTIWCEGLTGNMVSASQRFHTPKLKMRHMKECCFTHNYCDECLLAKVLEKKYEAEE